VFPIAEATSHFFHHLNLAIQAFRGGVGEAMPEISCGPDVAQKFASSRPDSLIEDFIPAGFDILNPVRSAAADMDPAGLNEKFGDRITFWGGGVDTKRTLPFGTADGGAPGSPRADPVLGTRSRFRFQRGPEHPGFGAGRNVLATCEAAREHGHYV
jgi:hypothetical protein